MKRRPEVARNAEDLVSQKLAKWKLTAGIAVMALSLGLATGCGAGDRASSQTPARASADPTQSKDGATGKVPKYAYLRMSKCSLPRGGGGHVRIHRLSCKKAQKLVGPLANLKLGQHRRAKELVYRSKNYPQAAGWTCWGGFDPRAGPFRYVCWRRDQVLLFRFS
jgi:hypothetical protein